MTKKVQLVLGDITTLKVDDIVNAANCALSGGGGVDGAIHRAAGPELLRRCRQIGPCETGHAKITPGFNLFANYVIHAVGPVWQGGSRNEAALLASCYRESLKLAQQHQIETIAFPAISCGAYRYPIQAAAHIAITEIDGFLQTGADLKQIYLVLFDKQTYHTYKRVAQHLL
ncbi:MAG: O-acetyl-ADP-ribose deacetylase [Chloroflexota bacterium]